MFNPWDYSSATRRPASPSHHSRVRSIGLSRVLLIKLSLCALRFTSLLFHRFPHHPAVKTAASDGMPARQCPVKLSEARAWVVCICVSRHTEKDKISSRDKQSCTTIRGPSNSFFRSSSSVRCFTFLVWVFVSSRCVALLLLIMISCLICCPFICFHLYHLSWASSHSIYLGSCGLASSPVSLFGLVLNHGL